MNFLEIKSKIEKSNSADFNTVFNRSVELFKKTWLQGFLLVLFFIMTYLGIAMITVLPVVLLTGLKGSDLSYNNFWVSLFGMLFFSLILIVLFFVMTVFTGLLGGLYIIYRKADKGENYATSDFFVLLKKDTFLKTFKVTVASLGIILISYMMCFIPILYTAIPISYIVLIYAYNQKLSTTEIVKIAFAIGNKNWIVTFLLRIVTSLVAYVGVFLCGIGFFFTFALILIPQYFIYKDAVGDSDDKELDQIGSYKYDKI